MFVNEAVYSPIEAGTKSSKVHWTTLLLLCETSHDIDSRMTVEFLVETKLRLLIESGMIFSLKVNSTIWGFSLPTDKELDTDLIVYWYRSINVIFERVTVDTLVPS